MAKNFLFELVFLSVYLFPTVSARLKLSNLFNFEIKDYIPYIVVTVLLLTLKIISHKYYKDYTRLLNLVILYILLIFLSLFFPPIFFYTTEGFSKTTMALISVCIVGIILLIIGTMLGASKSLLNCSKIIICMCFMTILGVFVYLIVISFMSGFDVKIHVPFIVFILLLISLGLAIYFQSSLMKQKIILIFVTISGGLGYYILFYGILKEINKISLLLFWSDLWFILLSIYTINDINYSVIPKPYEARKCQEINILESPY